MNRRSTVIPALLFAVVPLLFIVGVVAFQLLKNVPEARIARANTLASFKLIRAANAVDEAIQDAERGQRGFLITGREAYLDPYARAKERLPQLMIELQQASVASPDQQPRLLRLESDITTKMNELAATITAMRQQGYGAAKAIVNTNAGLVSMAAVRGDLRAIMDAADARLDARLVRAEAGDERFSLTFVVGSIIAALGLLAGGFLLEGAYRRAAMSQRLLQATLDSVREGVAAFDPRGRLRVWNHPFVAMSGVAARRASARGAAFRRGSAKPACSPKSSASRAAGRPAHAGRAARANAGRRSRSSATRPRMAAMSQPCST